MTIAEIIYTLEQKLQILGSNVYSNLLPQEILLQFDNVVDRYIDACLSPKPEGSLLGIADTQLKVDNLRLLKVPETILTFSSNSGNNGALFTLPSNYRNLINDSSEVLICGVATWVGNRQIGDEEVKENIDENPFLKPRAWSPTSRIIGNFLLVSTAPGNIATRVKIEYFKKPTRLYDEYIANGNEAFQFADFPRNVQELFIDLLRNRFLETFESQRLPGAIQETNNFGTITNI